jgi:hypothetical protein
VRALGTSSGQPFTAGRIGPPAGLSGGGATACAPRPDVAVSATPAADGSLQVTVSARTSAGTSTNALQALRFGATTNALVDVGAQGGASGNFTVTLPPGTQQTTFTVRRAVVTQAVTVPLTVVDACGDWPTFVGRGPT